MKKDIVQLVIAFFTLVFGGATEELAPKTLGVGLPVLLSAASSLIKKAWMRVLNAVNSRLRH